MQAGAASVRGRCGVGAMFGAIGKLIGLGGSGAKSLCHLVGNRDRLKTYLEAVPAHGIEAQHFGNVAQMMEVASCSAPDLVFVDLGLGIAAARAAIDGVAALPKHGAIQLVAPVKITTYEQVGAVGQLRLHGDKLGIKMPQALQPPFDGGVVKKLAQEFGLRRNDSSGKPAVTLNQAMKKDWLELWYQPKIDLATKRLVGAEGLIRVRHPQARHDVSRLVPARRVGSRHAEDDRAGDPDLAARLGGPVGKRRVGAALGQCAGLGLHQAAACRPCCARSARARRAGRG